MGFDWYKANDTDLADTSYTLNTTAGTASAAIELHAWLNKGSSVGSAETRYLRLYVEDPASPGTFRTSGLDVLDRREIECRIIGSQNPLSNPSFVCATTAWKAIGTRRTFQLPAIYPDCAIELEFRANPGYEGGGSSPVTFRVKAVQGTGDVPMSIPEDVTVDGDLDFGGNALTNVEIPGPLLVDLDVNSKRLKNVPLFYVATEANDAASVGAVRAAQVKPSVRLVATAPVTWPNVVTNGDFPTDLTGWTGTNWAQSAGTALHTAGATDPLVQSVTIVDAVVHRITVTVSGAAGTVTPAVGSDTGTPIAAGAGTVTQEVLATAGGALSVSFIPTTDFDGSLDDILVETLYYGLPDPIDSVTVLADDRLLLAGEVDSTFDGKWIAKDAAPWVRHPDSIAAYYLGAGAMVFVREGTVNLKSLWLQVETIANLATDPQTWVLLFQAP